jgi:hypothetical protein
MPSSRSSPNGVCTEDEVPEGMIYRSQFPQGADEVASRFKVFEGYHIGSFDELGSALAQDWDVFYGIMVGGAFGNLDHEGVAPVGGSGGHCMAGYGLKKVRGGQWGVRNQNSWGKSWGDGGRCVLVEEHFTYGQRYGLDAVAIRACKDDPSDPLNPPKVAA